MLNHFALFPFLLCELINLIKVQIIFEVTSEHFRKSKPDSMPSKVRKPPDPKFAKEAFVYCADLVKKRDYENYLALMLMPKLKQPRIIAVSF